MVVSVLVRVSFTVILFGPFMFIPEVVIENSDDVIWDENNEICSVGNNVTVIAYVTTGKSTVNPISNATQRLVFIFIFTSCSLYGVRWLLIPKTR